MNPTDQARKEDRKKQLKKHKKQREQVREAVIKNKNPNTGQLTYFEGRVFSSKNLQTIILFSKSEKFRDPIISSEDPTAENFIFMVKNDHFK